MLLFSEFFLSKRYLRYHNFHTYNVRIIAISYLSENHFRTITILYHCQFVPYADRYIITISYHIMQIDTLWPYRTICRSTHYDHFVPYADRYIITISYHMQINTLWPFRTICRSTHYDYFVNFLTICIIKWINKIYENGPCHLHNCYIDMRVSWKFSLAK